MEECLRQLLDRKINQVIKEGGHGEVILKLKNGYIWRVLVTCDTLIEKLPCIDNGR